MRSSRRMTALFLLLALPLVAASSPRAETRPMFVGKWGSNGTLESQFDLPLGVAVDAAGNVYVSDTYNHRIQKFDRDGDFLRMWGWGVNDGTSAAQICYSGCQAGTSGGGNGQMSYPRGIAVDASGNVYVASFSGHRIHRFTGSGNFINQWGSLGSGKSGLQSPAYVAVDKVGDVYVSDSGNSRIVKYNSNGSFISTWGWGVKDGTAAFQICRFSDSTCQTGIVGANDGQFDDPQGLAVDSIGNIYVVETGNDRVQKFDPSLPFVLKWGTSGTGDGEFDHPRGAAVDSSGNVYVAGNYQKRMQKFDSVGTYVTEWGVHGTADGEFYTPSAVAVSVDGYIYVTDVSLHRVQRFVAPWLDVFVADPEMPGRY